MPLSRLMIVETQFDFCMTLRPRVSARFPRRAADNHALHDKRLDPRTPNLAKLLRVKQVGILR